MGMSAGKLTAHLVRDQTKPGSYGDGNGLWLMIRGPRRRWWAYRYMIARRQREISIGNADQISLNEARNAAQHYARMRKQGIDPLEERHAPAAAISHLEVTFEQAKTEYMAAHRPGWRNVVHAEQWRTSLANHAASLDALPVAEITTDHILNVLRPIWQSTTDTAARVRGRIEMILDYAKARGWRSGDNPARWKGHLAMMLPAKGKIAPIKHHEALDWRQAPAFMANLRNRDGMGALALQFAILTAARPSEVRGAPWSEIDLDHGIWIIPPERMKANREHRVPLSVPAARILLRLAEIKDGSGLIFFSRVPGKMLSAATMLEVLKRMDYADLTGHGFRSTFRDWAAEATPYPNHVVEMALAHSIGAVEAAYRRGDLFEKRQALMADWAAFLARPPAQVVPLPKGQPAHRLAAAEARA